MSTSPLSTEELNCLRSSIANCNSLEELDRISELLTDIPIEYQASRANIQKNLETYCPHKPWPKQQFVLDLDCPEIFFGGAKGPGKTDLLLMAGLRYVNVPGYSVLYLRKDTQRGKQANSIMDRCRMWMADKPGVRWNGQDNVMRFPSGAMFKFGYIDNPADAYLYHSSEYQLIAFDEFTEFRIVDGEDNLFTFMFGMLRAPIFGPLALVPRQMLCASNPGGIAHRYALDRFVTEEAMQYNDELIADLDDGEFVVDPEPRAFYSDDRKRCYVPATITDNPAIDAKQYIEENLNHLPPVKRARYVLGDWRVQEDALIAPDWLRYYDIRGGSPDRGFQDAILEPLDASNNFIGTPGNHLEIHDIQLRRFVTIDTAGTSEEKAKEKKGKPPSWSVIGVWDYWSKYDFLFCRHVWRKRVEYPELKQAAIDVCQFWRPMKVYVENKHFGPVLVSELQPRGIACEEVLAVDDKVTRAVPLMNRMKDGKLFLPRFNNSWLSPFEAELLSWTGDKEETNDQVDMSSYAAIVAQNSGGGVVSGVKGSKPGKPWIPSRGSFRSRLPSRRI